MSKQSWKGSTLLNPEPPVLVSCGGLDKPNLITIGWTGTICTHTRHWARCWHTFS